MVAEFTILGSLPGLNDYTRACRTNPHVGAAMKREAEDRIRPCINCAGLPHFDGPVSVHVAWHERDNRRDPDNIRFGIKFILDALVKTRVLDGDSRKHVASLSDSFATDRTKPRIVVTIERTAQ